MAEQKKYAGLEALTSLIQNIKSKYSLLGHKHTKSEITDFPTSLKNPNSLTIQGNGVTLTNGTYDGSAAKTVNITASAIGAAPSTHVHGISDVTNLQSSLDAKVPTSRTINGKALSSNITLSASDVGADASGAATSALNSAKAYTDSEIAALINGAPTTLDTLDEIAAALEDNADIVEVLESAIGAKANASDLTSHTGNKNNPHGVTAAQVNAYTKSEVDTKLETKANASALATAQSKLDTIESNAQVNVNPDWNENDATKDSYIQNRPFYTGKPVLTTVVDNVSFTTTDYNGLGAAQNPFTLTLEENKDYVVTWNGTDYRTTCTLMEGLLAIGNGSIFGMGEDTGAPFLIGASGSNIMLYATSVGSVTITIKRDDAEVHKINPKYIDMPKGAYVGEARQNGAEVFNDCENNVATGTCSHAEGAYTEAAGHWSHSEGYHAKAYGRFSHAEGWATKARGEAQHVQGRYNVEDTSGTYAHIVGNGTSSVPSNAHTLDWNGNAWYKGTIKVGGTSYADASEVALVSTASLSIPTSGWTEDSASGFYRLAISNSSITADSVVNVNLDIISLVKAEDCGLKGVTESYAGGFYVYAESVPTSALTGTLIIQN